MTTDDISSSHRVIKLIVAYDGTDFCGWQRQTGQRSVQEEIEKALAIMHKHDVTVVAAGRTDAGVHAVGQVIHFKTDIKNIKAERFEMALNSLLPKDVRIISGHDVPNDFNARFNASKRRYKYFIRFGRGSFPHLDRYAWHIFSQPNIQRLNNLASCLRGEIDCTSFSAAQDKSKSRFRYIYHAIFYIDSSNPSPFAQTLVFDIAANAFLWRMVRSIVGTLIELDAAGAEKKDMQNILDEKNRSSAGISAPARGLFLWHVDY